MHQLQAVRHGTVRVTAAAKPVIVVGASGVFGRRLVEQLVACGVSSLVLAGRRVDTLKALKLAIAPLAEVLVLDRLKPEPDGLIRCRGGVLIDAAGPFQNSGMQLIEACIAAGVNYIDLADARDFVTRVPSLDAQAKAAGVFVISGASTTPALSHAVIEHFTEGWQSIHSIFVGITPGNRAPRGEAVVRAILSYAGAPFTMFANGGWREVTGWSGNERRAIPGIGSRNFVHCETPDQDLLVQRFQPKASAVFKAGLELGIMHHGLRVLAWLRSIRVLNNLVTLTPALLIAANVLKIFGTDKGGMLVEVKGKDATGKPSIAVWSLLAEQGVGPNVPGMPALALVLKRDKLKPGARAAAGEVALAEVLPHFARLGIITSRRITPLQGPQVFEQALGAAAWVALPDTTRAIHRSQPGVVLRGEAAIVGAETAFGRLVSRLFGFPPANEKVSVIVIIESDGKREHWRRQFGDTLMASAMTVADGYPGCVEEHFGPLAFRMKLEAGHFGLNMVMDGVRIGPIALPRFLLPDITAEERVDAAGRHQFNVSISKWPLGLLVHYRGWLQPV
jgi:saccharopine dehydrogenase-like NADP-dependent oxidoreductase